MRDEILPCPHCGSPAEHESTICMEIMRCTLCPAMMKYEGSGTALIAMWNFRTEVKK